MSHKSIRILIERAVKSIHDDINYSYGKETDFNQKPLKDFVSCNVTPVSSTITFAVDNVFNYSKTWSVQMAFYMIDRESSLNYADILDKTDDLCNRFINQLNLTDTVVLTNMNQTPFIKAIANTLTGHLLSFNIQDMDDFDYCDDCDDR